jgi:hypothetical protein
MTKHSKPVASPILAEISSFAGTDLELIAYSVMRLTEEVEAVGMLLSRIQDDLQSDGRVPEAIGAFQREFKFAMLALISAQKEKS